MSVYHPPRPLDVTRDLVEEERRDGRSGNGMGTGLTGCLNTEATWELDKVGSSSFSNADRLRPVGTPVRWERGVHRASRATVC
jgi:hypothetical protein